MFIFLIMFSIDYGNKNEHELSFGVVVSPKDIKIVGWSPAGTLK